MKGIAYWIIAGVLLVAEVVALWVAIAVGPASYVMAGVMHFSVALLFAVLIGIHRRAVAIALLSIPVIAANPVIGLLTMFVIDEKFNRETQKRFLEASANFRSGNPFGSFEGVVEVADNAGLTRAGYVNLMRKLTGQSGEAELREVEVLAAARKLSALPVMERVASTTTNDGRVLAQAAIQEATERVSIWARNLRNFVEREKPVPPGLVHLAVEAFIEIRRMGRNPQSFGLPDFGVLREIAEGQLNRDPSDFHCASLLCELLAVAEKFEDAERVIENFRGRQGFDYELEKVRLASARGDWIACADLVPGIPEAQWERLPSNAAGFWKTNSTPVQP